MTRVMVGVAVASGLLALAAPAAAQIRAPSVDPASQGMSALSLKLDALAKSAGRQVVSFYFAPGDMGHWTEANNNYNANAERAETLCQQLLGDRYGRAVSRRPRSHENGWYFSHLVCETKP